MNNSVWKGALYDALGEEYSCAMLCTEPQTPHVFSQRHETRMTAFFSSLTRHTDSPQERFRKTRLHRTMSIAAAVLAISIGCTMAVSSDDSPFSHFQITFSDVLSSFNPVPPASNASIPETIEETYVITYDLPEFEITNQHNTGQLNYAYYSDGGDHIIYFMQYTLASNFYLNTEDSNPIEIEFGDGQKGIYYFTNQKYDNLIWEMDGYTFVLAANIGKDALIHMAESVQKSN